MTDISVSFNDRETVNHKSHELVSVIFSAPFIALYTITRIFLAGQISIHDLIQSLLWLTIIPIIIPLYYSVRLGVKWDYPRREDRLIPFLIINLGYLTLLIVSLYTRAGKPMLFLASSYLVNGLVAWIISLKYKISIHMIGISGPATFLLLQGCPVDSVILYLIGLATAFSRHRMQRHTILQLIAGYIHGIVLTFTAYMVIYY